MTISTAFRRFGTNIALVALGAVLFALAFPSFLSDWGWGVFAWISLVPVVLLIRRISWWASPLWGAFYGYVTYALFNFWLATFNPVSFVIVPTIYAGWFFMLFPLLVLADRAFPRRGWLAQLLLWAAFEVVRTKGFIGYSYGVLGYSQYQWTSLISISDVFGVMGVGLLVLFPSFLLGGWLLERNILVPPQSITKRLVQPHSSRYWMILGGLWAVLVLLANLYGWIQKVDYSDAPTWKPALIQHNVNTWLSGNEAWANALDKLIEESEDALLESPDAIIWPETAFVPAIEWHDKYRQDRKRAEMVRRLKTFLAQQEIPVILGNNDSELDAGKKVDYNAVLLFDQDKIVGKYRKIHLVPFSEHFPYAKIFPQLMEYIESQGTPLYGKGTEFTTFNLKPWDGPVVSPFICFEDTFGYLARGFVNAGAQVLVNTTNDSWSPEPACAIQHLGMAVFRSVENRRSSVRATTAGLTAVIDPNGKIIKKIPPFEQGHIVADVPIYDDETTFYTRFGDWFEVVILTASGALVLAGIALLILRKKSDVGEM
ncbi:MAG: apolipoprotein N-acyltransferase [Spirochaetales bacterium]|nr:apolipoprotein N-acyltransferase [Spirochaetales bacterium]